MYSRARLLSSLAAGTAVLALASSAWAIGIRLNHPDIDTQVSPGELKTGSLSIENPSDRDMAIDVYVQDWKFKGAGNGEKVFFPPGELSNSASKWITLNPARMTLPPFSKREVNYSIAVPNDPNLSGMYHSVIFYESVAGEAVDTQGASVLVSARLGTVVRISMAGTTRREGRIQDIAVKPPAGSRPAEFTVTFENTGNVDIFLNSNVLMLDAGGQPKARSDLEVLITEGGQTASRTSTWAGRLDPGEYTLLFTFDLGEGRILSDERKMTVAPAAS